MNLEKLKDQVAAAVFCALVQRNEHGKEEYASIKLIAAEAWEYADAFLDERPARRCETCVHRIAENPP